MLEEEECDIEYHDIAGNKTTSGNSFNNKKSRKL